MKITKNQRIETLELKVAGLTTMLTMLQVWSDHADNMLTELNHALPDPEYDAKCEAQEADIDASLDRHRERLGLNKPQLKQLTQSVFDGQDSEWQWAALDSDGDACLFSNEPEARNCTFMPIKGGCTLIGKGYDATDWQNSLIERDDIAKKLAEVDLSSELTGSELCKAMLARGDKWVVCMVANNINNVMLATRPVLVFEYADSVFKTETSQYEYAVPINNQGEPLTAAEVGL